MERDRGLGEARRGGKGHEAGRLTSSKAATLNFGLLLVTVVLPTKSSHGHSLLRVGEKVGTIKHGAPSVGLLP
jgi:hypothetical protein